jgi:putative ABC transport system substrate-binding protein
MLGATALASLPVGAAYPKTRTRRIGVLMSIAASDAEAQARLAAFTDALQKLGWTADHNLQMDVRWAAGDRDSMRTQAAELVSLQPDVLLANGTSVLRALQQETRTIPIVFVQIADPVGAGFVASAERPGGNITGFINFNAGMGAKWLELLKQAAPQLKHAVIIRNPAALSPTHMLHEIEAVAPSLGVDLSPVSVIDGAEIKLTIEKFARQPNVGLIVLPDPIATVNRDLIVALAAKHKLPAIYPYRFFADSGGLMSYGVDTADVFRRAAAYVHRILRGESPGKLPVQQPAKFELIINLSAAQGLGLSLSRQLVAGATELIE